MCSLAACSVSLTLSLRQDVQLLRDEDIEVVKASKNSTGIMNPNNLKQGVLIKVDEFIKDFVRDYRKASGQQSDNNTDVAFAILTPSINS